MNPIDTKLRAKLIYYPDKLPAILGCDGAGIVERTGSAVTRFKRGRRGIFLQWRARVEIWVTSRGATPNTLRYEEYCAASPANLGLQGQRCNAAGADYGMEALIERATAGRANYPDSWRRRRRGAYYGAACPASGARVAVTVSDDKKEGLAQRASEAEKIIRYKEEEFVQDVVEWAAESKVDVVPTR